MAIWEGLDQAVTRPSCQGWFSQTGSAQVLGEPNLCTHSVPSGNPAPKITPGCRGQSVSPELPSCLEVIQEANLCPTAAKDACWQNLCVAILTAADLGQVPYLSGHWGAQSCPGTWDFVLDQGLYHWSTGPSKLGPHYFGDWLPVHLFKDRTKEGQDQSDLTLLVVLIHLAFSS